MLYLKQLLAGLVLLATSTSSFADDLFAILKGMSEADHDQNYQGTFILRKGDKLSTLRVTHGADENGDWENLQSLSGESKNIFRRNRQVISVFPERDIVTVRYTDDNHSLHPRLPGNLDQLEHFYSMERLEDDRIANHGAIVIDLLPNDKYRYGYRYWVDKNTGMLLRCDLYDEDKTVIEQMMFTSLEYLSEPPLETMDMKKFDQLPEQNTADPGKLMSSGEKVFWAVNTLPKGFMLTQSILRNKGSASEQNDEEPAGTTLEVTSREQAITAVPEPVGKNISDDDLLHMVYSDGLASVSVFIEKNSGGGHLHGAASMGAVNAFGQSIDGYFVTVVGEVPATTVQVMAQSTVRLQ